MLILGGCLSVPTGKYLPWNWGHGSEASKATKALAKLDDAKSLEYKKAQEASHKAQDALKMAEFSLPVAVAIDFNNEAVALLDQANGPALVGDLQKWEKQVQDLCSEDPKIRQAAERILANDREETARLSRKIADLSADLERRNLDLKDALVKETETANKYRNLKYGFLTLVLISIIGYVGMIYLKLTVGGVPMALGRALTRIRATSPDVASLITETLDDEMDRREKAAVRKHAQP